MTIPSRRLWKVPSQVLLLALAIYALTVPACGWDGHFTVLGYNTQPNYDLRIHTVGIPVFKNKTYFTVTPVPGMEMDLTRAVVKQIELVTPYKVVQCDPDTELRGVITIITKNPVNYNQLNEVREVEVTMVADIIWRNLRTGEELTRGPRRALEDRQPDVRMPLLAPVGPVGSGPSRAVPLASVPTQPSSGAVAGVLEPEDDVAALNQRTPRKPVPVVIRSVAYYRPELGESLTTALQQNVEQMAVQIVSAMEKGW